MSPMTYEQLRSMIGEAHGDKNDRGWRKNTKPTNKKKEQLREDDDDNIRDLEKDIRFCKDALGDPSGRSAMNAKSNYGKDWKKQTKVDLKNAMAKLKKLDPSNYLLKEDEDEELEVDDNEEGEEEDAVKIVTFKTTDKYLVDILQSSAGINGITISTTDDVQTFGPDSFDDIEVNDWSEDDVEDDNEENIDVDGADGEEDTVDVED